MCLPHPNPVDGRDPVRDGPALDRRRWRRLPVTLSARVEQGRRSYRARILDLSAGGLLLAPVPGLAPADGALQVTAALIGQVPVRVVAVSPAGVHVAVEEPPDRYAEAVLRLADLMRAWNPLREAFRGAD